MSNDELQEAAPGSGVWLPPDAERVETVDSDVPTYYWHYFAGVTGEEATTFGPGVLVEAILGPAPTSQLNNESIEMATGASLSFYGTFDHRPRAREKWELLPPDWQEEYPLNELDDALQDDLDDEDDDERLEVSGR